MINIKNRMIDSKTRKAFDGYLEEFPHGTTVGSLKVIGRDVFVDEGGWPALRVRRKGHKFSEWMTIQNLRIARANDEEA